ncbi:MAG: MBL fold metallo-hydrolase [Myxococcota bacterium]
MVGSTGDSGSGDSGSSDSGSNDSGSSDSGGSPTVTSVELTWAGVTNWIVQYGETAVLLDAFYSRPGLRGATPDGLDLASRVLAAAGIESLDFVLVGHSHFDHAIDAGPVALATGATVIGSQTTCFVAEAQGLGPDRCRAVVQGDVLRLGEAEVRVVRTLHSSPATLGAFDVYTSVPPENEVARAPTGGALSYRFAFGEGGPSFTYQNSFAAVDGEDGSSEDYRANLVEGGGLTADLWITAIGAGFASAPEDLQPYLEAIGPRFVIPHHWDGFFASPETGLNGAFTLPSALAPALEGVQLEAPVEYFDRWRLEAGALTKIPSPIQEALGL